MSSPEEFAALAQRLTGMVNDAVDRGESAALSNDAAGGLLAALVALYAAKVQSGEDPVPFGGNSRPVVTDVAIVCTALMDAVGLELFELGGWQTMSGLGRLKPGAAGPNAPLRQDNKKS